MNSSLKQQAQSFFLYFEAVFQLWHTARILLPDLSSQIKLDSLHFGSAGSQASIKIQDKN